MTYQISFTKKSKKYSKCIEKAQGFVLKYERIGKAAFWQLFKELSVSLG